MSSIERAMERMRRVQPVADTASEQAAKARPAPAPSGNDQESRVPTEPDVVLDRGFLRERGLLTPDADCRHLQEQYRLVKRQIIHQGFTEKQFGPNPGNLIEITSSMANEGKTFTAFNLGVSIAMELDHTVLLVDTDLTRRTLSHLVGLDDRPGVTDVLTGAITDVSEAVFRTDIPRLVVMPAGQSHARSTELIASQAMKRLTRELASRYSDRVVMFDSTPLLMDSQAATLAGHMGQALVVVEAGRTQEQVLREAIGLLDQSKLRAALLLNKSSRGYGYGYYGGYG